MKRIAWRLAGITLILMTFVGCPVGILLGVVPYPDEFHRGRVIDAETGEPIAGAVVLGVWTARVFGGYSHYYESKEVLTDEKGEFSIPPLGMLINSILPNGDLLEPMEIVILKAGYEMVDYMKWDDLKVDTLFGKPVKWEKGRAIIPLKKWTERDEIERPYANIVKLPADMPREKRKLMHEEERKLYKKKR